MLAFLHRKFELDVKNQWLSDACFFCSYWQVNDEDS